MSQEDKQFFDGMFVGAIIVGLVLVTIIAFFLFTSGEEVGENISEPPDLIEQQPEISDEPVDVNELSDDTDDQLLDEITIKGEQYVIIQVLEHTDEDQVFRLLVLKSAGLLEKVIKYNDPFFSTAFNGDTLYYTSRETPAHGEKVVFSFWTSNGQELVSIDENNEEIPSTKTGTVSVLKWQGDKLILEAGQGDAGFGSHDIFKYNPEDKSVFKLLSYQTGWYINADTDTEIIYTTWSQNERTVGQIVDTDGGPYSNLYYLPSKNIEWESINQYLIAFSTTSEVGVDIKSDNNLIRYAEGLEIIVEGKNEFIPWTVK